MAPFFNACVHQKERNMLLKLLEFTVVVVVVAAAVVFFFVVLVVFCFSLNHHRPGTPNVKQFHGNQQTMTLGTNVKNGTEFTIPKRRPLRVAKIGGHIKF